MKRTERDLQREEGPAILICVRRKQDAPSEGGGASGARGEGGGPLGQGERGGAKERATHHGAFVDGVEAHDGDVEEDGGGLVAALRGSHLVVVPRVVGHDVLELQRAVVHAALARAAKGTRG